MISTKADELQDKKEQSKMDAWIDSLPSDFNFKKFAGWVAGNLGAGGQTFGPILRSIDATDVWDRSAIQKTMEAFKEAKFSKLETKQVDIGDYIRKGNVLLDGLANTAKALINGEYQTPNQVAAADKQLKIINQQRNDIYKAMKAKAAEYDQTIEEMEDVQGFVGKLERNYNLMPVLVNNTINSAIDLGQGIEELAFRVANLPNELISEFGKMSAKGAFIDKNGVEAWDKLSQEEKDKINKEGSTKFESVGKKFFPAYYNLGASYLVNGWSIGRDKANAYLDEYSNELMGDIAEPISIGDIETGDQWGRYFFQTTGQILPQMTTMVALGGYPGIFAVTAMAGGNRLKGYNDEMTASRKAYDDWLASKPVKQEGQSDDGYADQLKRWQDKNPGVLDYSMAQMWGGAGLSMGAEFAGSRLIALPMINRAKAFGSTQVKAGFNAAFAKNLGARSYTYFGDLATEAGEEVFADLTGNLYDRYVMGKDINVFEGLADSAFSGMFMANGFKVGGAAQGYFSPFFNAVQTPGDRLNIKK